MKSSRGFDNLVIKDVTEFVLSRGGSGTVNITISSQSKRSVTVALVIAGVGPDFREWRSLGVNSTLPSGVTVAFRPTAYSLEPGEKVSSLLTITVDSKAETGTFKLSVFGVNDLVDVGTDIYLTIT